MSVKRRERKNGDGTISQFLDIYHKGERQYEFLPHLKFEKGSTPDVRQRNKERKDMANKIAVVRAAALSANEYSISSDQGKKVVVLVWMQKYVDNYRKKDIRTMVGVQKKFSTFLESSGRSNLIMRDFNEQIVLQFLEALCVTSEGEGAKSYYGRFRKMVKQACREKVLLDNPCLFVRPPKGEAESKEVLNNAELQILANTETNAKEVKRAFLFCSFTGIRWVDCNALTWSSIDLKNKALVLKQSKTERGLASPLHSVAIELLGIPGNKSDKVFNLPSPAGANKSLKLWVKRAGIDKKITWHCSRHGFATALAIENISPLAISSLMGHSSLKYVKRYTDAAKQMNRSAVDSLPQIRL